MLTSYFHYYLIFVIAACFLLVLLSLGKKKIGSLKMIIGILAALFALPLVAGYLYLTYFTSLPVVEVPVLTGMTLEEAMNTLASLDLRGKHAGSVFDMKYPEGMIVSQSPESGRKVKLGRVITLLTSSGRQRVTVPNLLGRPAAQAEAVLSAEGLTLGKESHDVVPEIDAGTILTQSPLPGEEVDINSAVDITVSVSNEAEAQGSLPATAETKEEGGFRLW